MCCGSQCQAVMPPCLQGRSSTLELWWFHTSALHMSLECSHIIEEEEKAVPIFSSLLEANIPFSHLLGTGGVSFWSPWVWEDREVACPSAPSNIQANLKRTLTRVAKPGEKEATDRSRLLHLLSAVGTCSTMGFGNWVLPIYESSSSGHAHAHTQATVKEVTVTKYL